MSIDLAPQNQRILARRNQVLDAASICFVEQGFHAASMSKIAKQAQMSPGHIYHYFKNKDAIIQALVRRDGDRAIERISQMQLVESIDFIESFISQTAESASDKINPFQSRLNLEILAESQRNPEVGRIVQETDMRIHQKFVELLSSKLKLSDIDFSVDLLMTAFLGVTGRYVRNPEMDADRVRRILNLLIKTALQEVD